MTDESQCECVREHDAVHHSELITVVDITVYLSSYTHRCTYIRYTPYRCSLPLSTLILHKSYDSRLMGWMMTRGEAIRREGLVGRHGTPFFHYERLVLFYYSHYKTSALSVLVNIHLLGAWVP